MIGAMGVTLRGDDPVAVQVTLAVRGGDLDALRTLLAGDQGLANARIIGRRNGTSTPLHFVTDWPGYFPNGPGAVRILAEFGADPNARTTGGGDPYAPVAGPGDETPLHYAASSDDADVAEVLIDAGADLEAPEGSIGTPLANAIGNACWNVARLSRRPWRTCRILLAGRGPRRSRPPHALGPSRSAPFRLVARPVGTRLMGQYRHGGRPGLRNGLPCPDRSAYIGHRAFQGVFGRHRRGDMGRTCRISACLTRDHRTHTPDGGIPECVFHEDIS
jgi:hypothetical protein